MIEHRLIERMVKVLGAEMGRVRSGEANPELVRGAVDFFRVYADRTHHGKEEDILFRDLAKKQLSETDKVMMDSLIEEHRRARLGVGRLEAANERYVQGDKAALGEIGKELAALVELYPSHIEKEDKHFFSPAMGYLSAEELDKMLAECYRFDMNMIHEKYKHVVESAEGLVSGVRS